MQDLNDLYYFAMVVDHGGFAAAERALGIPKSRLSRRISQLETDLGVRLLQRSTRRFAVTDVGQSVHRHAQSMLAEAAGRARGGRPPQRRAARPGAGQRAGRHRAAVDADAAARVPRQVPAGARAAARQQPPRRRHQRRLRRRHPRAQQARRRRQPGDAQLRPDPGAAGRESQVPRPRRPSEGAGGTQRPRHPEHERRRGAAALGAAGPRRRGAPHRPQAARGRASISRC